MKSAHGGDPGQGEGVMGNAVERAVGRNFGSLLLIAACVLGLSVSFGASGVAPGAALAPGKSSAHQVPRTGALLTLAAPDTTGSFGTVVADVSFAGGRSGSLELITRPTGPVRVVGRTSTSWPVAGDRRSFPIDFELTEEGAASIEVVAVMRSDAGEVVGAHGAALSLYRHNNTTYLGTTGAAALARQVFVAAEPLAPASDFASSIFARSAFASATAAESFTEQTAEHVIVRSDGGSVHRQTPTVRIHGEVAWYDRPLVAGVDGQRRPAEGLFVRVRNANGSLLGVATTDKAGLYSVQVAASSADRVQIGISTDGPGFSVTIPPPPGSSDSSLQSHSMVSQLISIGEASEIEVTLNAASGSEMNAAIAVHQAITRTSAATSAVPVAFTVGPVVFPAPGKSLYLPTAGDSGRVRVSLYDAFDWDVILHEVGHKLAQQLGIEDSPGGPHDLADNLADILPKDQALRLAWSEGLATAFSLAVQQVAQLDELQMPFVGDTSYTDWEPVGSGFTGFTFNAEASEPGSNADAAGLGVRGAGEEAGVLRALWDLFDSVDDEGDTVTLGVGVFPPLSVSSATDFFTGWKALVSSQPSAIRAAAGCVASQIGAAATPSIAVEPSEDGSPPVIEWAPGGMGDAWPNTAFGVQVLDTSFLPLFAEVDVGAQTTWTPSQSQWTEMLATGVTHVQINATQELAPASVPIASCPVTVQGAAAPTATISTSCLAENGRIDVTILNETSVTQTIEFLVGSLTPRERVVPPGETAVLSVTGRPDGILATEVRAGGSAILGQNVVVSCDPLPASQPEVRIEKSCLAGNGRIDVHLTNPRLDVAAAYSVFVDAIPAKTRTVSAGGNARVSTTGRPDGFRPVRITRNGGEIFEERISIACDVDLDGSEVVLVDGCLLGSGRFDAYLSTPAATTTVYTLQVTGLTDRTIQVQPGDTVRETVTGRPDGMYLIQVRRAGVLVASEQRTVACAPA